MKTIAVIPARYKASRFPGKLLQKLDDKSVILHTYEATLATDLFEKVIVVTDSQLIYDEIKNHGGDVFISQKEHQTGSDRIAEFATDYDADIIINVQGDEPFVNKAILNQLMGVFETDTTKEIDIASLVFPIDDPAEINNPNNVKVVLDHQDFALYFSRAPIPYPRDKSQATYLQHIGVYAFRKEALMQFAKLPLSQLEKAESLENLRFITNGFKVKMLVTPHKSIGIDTEEDLYKARKFLKKTHDAS